MPLPFNRELDIKLLNCVKQFAMLYDPSDKSYMDCNARDVTWQKIGDEIKRPAKMCKLRWANIRDMMKRRIRERVRNPDQTYYTYRYESELSFLMPFFKESIAGSFNASKDFSEYIEDDDENPLSSCDVYYPAPMSDEDAVEPKDIKPLIAKSKRRKRNEDLDFSHSQIVEGDVGSHELNPGDPIDVFLMTIGTTLRSFSPYYLNQAKSKIFTVVQEYELQQIVEKDGQPPGAGGHTSK